MKNYINMSTNTSHYNGRVCCPVAYSICCFKTFDLFVFFMLFNVSRLVFILKP